MRKIIITLLLLIPLLSHAAFEAVTDEGGWVTRNGERVPNTDNMKSINGFGGWLVVTPDKDWEEKWNTPQKTIPHFSEAKTVNYGEALTILTFFINPKLNNKGELNILCDIKVVKPDNTTSINEKNINCGSGKLHGAPRNVRLAPPVIKYVGEEKDPPGTWVVEVVLIDSIRGTKIPLKAKFNLLRKANN